MVEIKYINGDIENVESLPSEDSDLHFVYLDKSQMFVVYTARINKVKRLHDDTARICEEYKIY